MTSALQQRFAAALDTLVAQIKEDTSILAAILCGSLSHDVVWKKSDIDLVLVTIDDKAIRASDLPIDADGVNVHAMLMPRAEFRKTVEGSAQQSFMHSFLAKGRLLYTHDESITRLCAQLGDIGARDTAVQLLRASMHALSCMDKAHKWFVTRHDLDYSALWILYAATPLAQIEIVSRGLLADREVIPQAAGLNPGLFDAIYTGLLNAAKTSDTVEAALARIDTYMEDRADTLFAPILDHLREVGEMRSAREIDDHFQRHVNVGSVTTACEYLAGLGRLARASTAVRLTKRSTIHVQELAFFYSSDSA